MTISDLVTNFLTAAKPLADALKQNGPRYEVSDHGAVFVYRYDPTALGGVSCTLAYKAADTPVDSPAPAPPAKLPISFGPQPTTGGQPAPASGAASP